MVPICRLQVLLLWSLSFATTVARINHDLHAHRERDLLTSLEQADQDRHHFLRKLEEGDRRRVRGSFGARCNDEEQNPCLPNLDCTNLGIPLGKRCAPVSCIAQEMELFQQDYDMEAFQTTIFAKAGINETEILENSRLGLPEEEASSLLSLREQFRTVAAAANPTALRQAMQSHPEPMLAMQGILQKCTATVTPAVVSRQANTNTNATNKQDEVITYYDGMHFEGGLALDASYTLMRSTNYTTNVVSEWGRICLGGLHLGAAFSFTSGTVSTNDAAAVPCVYWMAEIDLPVLFLPFSYSIGIGANGLTISEFGPYLGLLGLGLSAGLGGSMCGIFTQ
ncbi:expressed unknown protein [Seminavis robusta]|uniref:Uncharacterized protein n=1 Tax=Seminavis robusta TaxID=568900 RepID=A0A9N8DTQ6_9STRA|nr:expressed unknown protein [Seminavis robusta]|eukprot:Sro269_g104000.1 n/a (338) ;mRNA; f:39203-40216